MSSYASEDYGSFKQPYPPFTPPDNDPLVPPDFNGWFQRIIGVVRHSFTALAVLVAIITPISVVIRALQAAVKPDLTALRYGAGAAADVDAAMGQYTVVTLAGLLILLVASAYVNSAAVFVVIRDAAERPTSALDALRLGAGRALPLLGWQLATGIMMGVGLILLLVPGLYVAIVFSASLLGVVVVERQGIGRCFALVNRRFLATADRVLLYFMITVAYCVAVALITGGFGTTSVIMIIIQQILLIPLGIVAAAFAVVTYAELRFHEQGATTETLAAELHR